MDLGVFTARWNGRVSLSCQGAAHPCVLPRPVLTAGNAVLNGSQLVQCPTPLGVALVAAPVPLTVPSGSPGLTPKETKTLGSGRSQAEKPVPCASLSWARAVT